MQSLVVAHFEQHLKHCEREIKVTVFAIALAWVFGLVMPTVFLL